MKDIIMPHGPIPKDLLRQNVTDAIISYIHRNGLKTGDKLPSERDLAEEFSVGRNSIRQAMLGLEEENFIDRKTGKGSFVKREISAKSIQLRLLCVDYGDLLEMKICLERLAIGKAARQASKSQIANLKNIALKLCALADRGIFSIEVDREFHTALLDCAGSAALTQVVLSLVDSLNNYINMFGNVSEVWLKTVSYHLDIVNALEQGKLMFALAAHEYIYQQDIKVLENLTVDTVRD